MSLWVVSAGVVCGGGEWLGKHSLSLRAKSHLYDVFKAEKQNQERVKDAQAPPLLACFSLRFKTGKPS